MCIAALISMVFIIAVLSWHHYQMKKKMQQMNRILDDIANGNLDRKLIVKDHSELSQAYFKLNKIVAKYKQEIIDLQQSEKTYKQLVINLSHDIRTPLTSLMGYLSAIEDEVAVEGEKDEFLKLSYEKALILKTYIDTLFEWLKLESGERTFFFETVDFGELCREVMAEWIPQLEQNKIAYQIDIPDKETELWMDESSFHRILNNLLQNVILHSQAGEITIRVEEVGEKVCVSLKDNGIGISETDLPHIFERLYKCDYARNKKGNGLGLSIAAELIKANNGSIRAASKLGEGSCITMEFFKTK